MPIRVKSRAPQGEGAPPSPGPVNRYGWFGVELPDILESDSFRVVVKKLSKYVLKRQPAVSAASCVDSCYPGTSRTSSCYLAPLNNSEPLLLVTVSGYLLITWLGRAHILPS